MKAPYLLTPGPLTTSDTVKEKMLRDWGSRDSAFIAMNSEMRERLVTLANARGTHVCVPVQGSGTFAIEATIATVLPHDGKLLVLVNGAYGKRMVQITRTMGRSVEALEWREDQPVDPKAVEARLSEDRDITHVAVVHCETTSGILNPVPAVAEVVEAHGRALIIDAMSAFGALPVDATALPFTAVVASSNKCLQGVPGMGFALIRRDVLERCKGNAHSLSLDLFDQWDGFEKNGQWRFTPPTQVIAAFLQALDEHAAEGGVEGRGARYARNHEVLVDGMEALGFRCLLARKHQAPIIVTFHMPADAHFRFADFYERLSARGFLIYPGKLTVADSFRIGCIGDLGETEMRAALDAIASVLEEMGVHDGAPALTA
ncbi:MAG: 2-aminoethylphosphonate--pyruvate transaminase [Acidimicrobiales bacterium]|jgi:2-aminoethylphosphonate-pyruvate transaminase